MAGTLFHGREFETEEYIGNDGRSHFEVSPVEGGMDVVSISSWGEVLDFCESRRILRSNWPAFEDAFDVPLIEVQEKNERIGEYLLKLPPHDLARCYLLEKIVHYVRRGELFFFASA